MPLQPIDSGRRGTLLVEDINEALRQPLAVHTTSGAIPDNEVFSKVDTTAGVVTVTLPDPADYVREELTVKRIAGGNNAVVDPGAGHAIDNLGNGTTVTLAAVNDRIRLRSDGTQWWRVD